MHETAVCSVCNLIYFKLYWHQHSLSFAHKKAAIEKFQLLDKDHRNGVIINSTSNRQIFDIIYTCPLESDASDDVKRIVEFLEYFKQGLYNHIQQALLIHTALKVDSSLCIKIKKPVLDGGDDIFEKSSIRTENVEFYRTTNFDSWFTELVKNMELRYELLELMGSNWTFSRIIDLELHINKFTPLNGSSYIELPAKIKNQKAVINVKNADNKCFIYKILSRFVENERRDMKAVWKYNKLLRNKEFINSLLFPNFDGITYPTPFDEIKIFEKNNSCTVNIYALDEEEEVYPLHISKNVVLNGKHWDLLYLQDEEKFHYCYIKNLSHLVSSQKNKHKNTMLICRRCLLHFSSKIKLKEHEDFCSGHQAMRVDMPTKEKCTLKFEKYKFQQVIPYVIYANIEYALLPISEVSPSEDRCSYTMSTKPKLISWMTTLLLLLKKKKKNLTLRICTTPERMRRRRRRKSKNFR